MAEWKTGGNRTFKPEGAQGSPLERLPPERLPPERLPPERLPLAKSAAW